MNKKLLRTKNALSTQSKMECPECCSTDVSEKRRSEDIDDPFYTLFDRKCIDCQHEF